MRVLHSAAFLTPPIGVLNQMGWESEAAKRHDLDWDVRIFCTNGVTTHSDIAHCSKYLSQNLLRSKLGKVVAWVMLRIEYYRWLQQLENDYDYFLLRYYVHDPFQLWFTRQARVPVFFVHHALEAPELASSGGLGGKIRSTLERITGKHTLKHASGIVAVTEEILAHELARIPDQNKKCSIYPNGILYAEPASVAEDHRHGSPEILFVASGFAPWHGLDILLNEVKKSSRQFTLHLVGTLNDVDKSQALKDQRIRLHGRMSQPEIKQLASRCHIGLSSFALSRKGMKQACTLKVREYLMLGLPVYSGHKDIFPDEFPYYRHGKVDMDCILEFATTLSKVQRRTVSEVARPYIDKEVMVTDLEKFLTSD